MPVMTELTRSQFLLGATAATIPLRSRTPAPLAALSAAMRGPGISPAAPAMRACARSTTAATPPAPGGRGPAARPGRPRGRAARRARARHRDRIRAGGHNYIGASTVAGGVVLDLRRLRGIKLQADGTVVAERACARSS